MHYYEQLKTNDVLNTEKAERNPTLLNITNRKLIVQNFYKYFRVEFQSKYLGMKQPKFRVVYLHNGQFFE